MPSFNFNIVKRVNNNCKKLSTSKYEIKYKNVQGVVFIDIDANYSVKVDNKYYPIRPSNFNTKGVTDIYSQFLNEKNQIVLYIRDVNNTPRVSKHCYLPFGVSCIVVGDVVCYKYTSILIFDIKKVYINYDNLDAKQAIKFYRDNYSVIQNNLMKRIKLNE